MTAPVYPRDTSSFARVLGFLDAIYAFAVTLLVVNIDVSSPEAWSSIEAFFTRGIGAQLLGFIISFLVIIAFWRRNHAMLANFSAMDSTTITWNIVVAGLIIFIPFTTQGISDPTPTSYHCQPRCMPSILRSRLSHMRRCCRLRLAGAY